MVFPEDLKEHDRLRYRKRLRVLRGPLPAGP